MKKKILVGASPHWNSPFRVGSHHIAKGFADSGWKVGFLSAPISPFHLLAGKNPELNVRWDVYKSMGQLEYNDKIWCYVPGALLTPNNRFLLRSNWIQRNWYKLSLPSVKKIIKKNGFGDVDILYIDSPSDLYLLDAVEYKRSIYRIADNCSGFPNSTPAMISAEKAIASRVDVVLYTAKNLEEHVKSLSPKRTEYFPNGVNYHHFADGDSRQPHEFDNMKHPILLYVGAIDEWFDYDLINETAKKLPKVSFVLIGPDSLAKERLKKLPNIHILGPRKYSDLPGYMKNADAGLIPFDMLNHSSLINSINPLKLFEYMACGLPVISVEWEQLLYLGSPALLYKTADEFREAISKVTENPRLNKHLLQNFAIQHDWDKKLEQLFQL